MIKSYTDHAANERTFLAWIRTAIAMMAFGFLLERFDLFLQIVAVTLGPSGPRFPALSFGRDAGLGLLVVGAAMTAVSAVRYLKTRRDILNPELRSIASARLDVAMAALLAVLGLALALYLAYAVVPHSQ